MAVADMEEIIPNKLFIKEIKAAIAFYKHIDESHPKEFAVGLRIPYKLSGVRRGRESFRDLAHRVIEQNAEEKIFFRKVELKERNIVKLCWIYPRMRGKEIKELSKQFFDLKRVMVAEEEIIDDEFKKDPHANVMALIDQLDLQVEDMRKYILDADLLTALQEELEKTRSKYIANGFRVTFQFLMELGSLISSIIEAIYSYLGSTSTAAKVAGVSLFVINIVLSWINTAFSKDQEIEAVKLQKLHQIHAQAIYVSRLEKRIAEERRTVISVESKSGKAEECSRAIGGGMDQLPLVGASGSPLRECIYRLYLESAAKGAVPLDWRTALPSSADGAKSQNGKARVLGVDELMIPCRRGKSSSHESAIPSSRIPAAERKSASTIDVVVDHSPKPTGLEGLDQLFE